MPSRSGALGCACTTAEARGAPVGHLRGHGCCLGVTHVSSCNNKNMSVQALQKIVWLLKSSRIVEPSTFVKVSMRLIPAAIPFEKVDNCCWMYSKNAFDLGAHLPIFLISTSSCRANLRAHTHPDLRECVSILSIRIPLSSYFRQFAANLMVKMTWLLVAKHLSCFTKVGAQESISV